MNNLFSITHSITQITDLFSRKNQKKHNPIKTTAWIIVIGFIFVFSCIAIVYNTYFRETGTIAYIYQDGICIYSIDLSTVTESKSFVITGEQGNNTILIEEGKICISEADCPDQVCVRSGWLTNSVAPIVCLPHKLVISLVSEDNTNTSLELDGVAK